MSRAAEVGLGQVEPDFSEGAGRGPSGPQRAVSFAWYVGPSALGAVALLAVFRVWTWPRGGIWLMGDEAWWVQAMAQVHMPGGPVGSTDHIGWPLGFSPWSHPQLGLFFGVFTWVMGRMNIGSVMAILLALVVAGFFNGLAVTFFLRSIFGDRMRTGVALVSLAAAFCPFVIQKQSNWNVAAYFVVPLLLGVVVRSRGMDRKFLAWFALAVVVGLGSPAWWLVVMLLTLGGALVASSVSARWQAVRALLPATVAAMIATAGQWVIQASYKDPSAIATRGAWDSNVYGGHLTDLLLGSPWLNSLTTRDDLLVPGASVELNPMGLILTLCAGISILAVAAVFPWGVSRIDPTSALRIITSTSVLFFLAGGLGNLQAAAAILLGGESPARVWSRMLTVLAVLGSAWLLAAMQPRFATTRRMARGVVVVLVAVSLPIIWLDGKVALLRANPVEPSELPEFGSVQFLRGAKRPCPVAQLPQDDFPMPRFISSGNGDTWKYLYYTGFVPYLMAPEFYWSYTSWYPGAVNGLQDLPLTLDDRSLEVLGERGFCGVMFDKYLSEVATGAGIALEGRNLGLSSAPDYSDDRFSLFLLDPPVGGARDLGPPAPQTPAPANVYVSAGAAPEPATSGPPFYWVTEPKATIAAVSAGEISMTLVPPPCAKTARVRVQEGGGSETLSVSGGGTDWEAVLAQPGGTLELTATSPSCHLEDTSADPRTFYYGIRDLKAR